MCITLNAEPGLEKGCQPRASASNAQTGEVLSWVRRQLPEHPPVVKCCSLNAVLQLQAALELQKARSLYARQVH